ncbi:hypothetical protein Tco_1204832 [Tanacetum coccineum]
MDHLTALMYVVQAMNILKHGKREILVIKTYVDPSLQENLDENEKREHSFTTTDDDCLDYPTTIEESDGSIFYRWSLIEPKTTNAVKNTQESEKDNINDLSYFQEKAMLAPANEVVDTINDHLLEKFPNGLLKMDDPSMTMEEYIMFEEEKARKRRKLFNWQTATYGKIRVSTPINDEFDFRISFDESDDEDYTIICDTNSFSYKMISVNNLKTDSKNDYEKVMPSIPSPKPAISCFDDLDFFNDFENEFPAIVYNDAQTSKSDLLTEPILSPQHIDEFNDKTSLSEYDEEEQNVLYFNDLFPFNIICSDDLKSEKDNDNDKINIIQSFENNESTHGSNTLFETSHDKNTKDFRTGSFVINLNVKIVIWIYYANGMLFYLIMNLCAPFGIPFDPKRYYKDGVSAKMLQRPRYVLLCFTFRKIGLQDMALPPREQRHRFLRYEGLEYPDIDIVDFERRLARIHMREVHRVPVFDFGGLLNLMAEGLTTNATRYHRY